jgi:hypothetical protein
MHASLFTSMFNMIEWYLGCLTMMPQLHVKNEPSSLRHGAFSGCSKWILDMEGSCEYTEEAVAESRQWLVSCLGNGRVVQHPTVKRA